MNDRPTREQVVAKVASHIKTQCGDDPVKIAEWAMVYAKRAYRIGYTQGEEDVLVYILSEMINNGEGAHASSLIAKLFFSDARSGRGSSGGGTGASPDGGSGIPAGEGTQAGEGTGSQREEAGDSIRSTGKGDHSARPGG